MPAEKGGTSAIVHISTVVGREGGILQFKN